MKLGVLMFGLAGCAPGADEGTGGSGPGSGGSASGGATATGGSGSGGTGTGGTTATGGGPAGSGGTTGSGGVTATGGAPAGSGGTPGAGGGTGGTGGGATGGRAAGTGGRGTAGATATGGTNPGTGGAATGGAAPGTGGAGGMAARFSFFMTSQAGLERLANNAKGFGGDLRFGQTDGLSGADEICRRLADASMPGNGKTWRAFLSVTKGPQGTPVNAIDRISAGPWYDRLGRLVTMNKAGVLQTRPTGAEPAIINDLPNEDGVPNHNPGTGIIDNHNVLTGSTAQGTIDSQGLTATCQDWTSAVASGGRPRCGVSWPRANLTNWISVLNEGGCAPGSTPGAGAQSGPSGTVGALGGYGGFYCFAATP